MTNINFDNISERDVDLVIMREFCTNKSFADLFLKQIGIENCSIVRMAHSVVDAALGESDVEITLATEEGKIALLIENKINAEQQPKQYERYIMRGDKKVNDGEADSYYVFMTAPQAYFSEVNQYRYRVTYEEMKDAMTDCFSTAIIKNAMEKRVAYQPIPDDAVSAFWSNLYDHAKLHYPNLYELMPTKTDRARGTRAQWPGFRTNIAGMEIQWKADRGAVDLQLNGMAGYETKIEKTLYHSIGEHSYEVVETGKSASIRKAVPRVDFHRPFAGQREKVTEALNAATEMYELAQNIRQGIEQMREHWTSPLLQRAIDIATKAHKGQKDKAGADYIAHPLRVAARLQDDEEKIVAVLHDTIEDTFVTPDYLKEQGFPQEIINGVLSVTRQENETYDDFVHRASRNPLGRAVKTADLEDNMDIRRLDYPMNDWDFERLNKYLKAYKYLKGLAET